MITDTCVSIPFATTLVYPTDFAWASPDLGCIDNIYEFSDYQLGLLTSGAEKYIVPPTCTTGETGLIITPTLIGTISIAFIPSIERNNKQFPTFLPWIIIKFLSSLMEAWATFGLEILTW